MGGVAGRAESVTDLIIIDDEGEMTREMWDRLSTMASVMPEMEVLTATPGPVVEAIEEPGDLRDPAVGLLVTALGLVRLPLRSRVELKHAVADLRVRRSAVPHFDHGVGHDAEHCDDL